MEFFYYLFAAAILVGALLATIAIWTPRAVWLRATAVAAAALFIPVVYLQSVTLLSRPKPVDFAWFERNVEKAAVLSANIDEGKAIYLWLRIEGAREPRFYVMPWHANAAETLEEALEAAVRMRGRLVLKRPFSPKGYTDLGELNVEIIPPPSLPMKPLPLPPTIYNPRDTEI